MGVIQPELPPKLEDIINKALEKDRNLRYQVAAEILAETLGEWFLARNKKNTRFRDRRGETLFIDARRLGIFG